MSGEPPKLEYSTLTAHPVSIQIIEDADALTITIAPPSPWVTAARIITAVAAAAVFGTFAVLAVMLFFDDQIRSATLLVLMLAAPPVLVLLLGTMRAHANWSRSAVVEVRDRALAISYAGEPGTVHVPIDQVLAISIKTFWLTPAVTGQLRIRRRGGFSLRIGQCESIEQLRDAASALRRRIGLPQPAPLGLIGKFL